MRTIKVNLKNNPYDIIAGNNIMNLLARYLIKLDIGSDAYIITNAPIKKRYAALLIRALKKFKFSLKFKIIPDSEKSKSLKVASSLLEDIAGYDKEKKIFIAAFGGGVVGDLSGFIASVYKRGIPYIQIPTTLLAQVDSSIGGKTGVDLTSGKNLAGTFYQPRLVFSETGFLKSLDLRQVRCGIAEVIKYGIIKDAGLFSYLEKNYRAILSLRPDALEFIVSRSSAIKAQIVGQDEKEEKGLRTVLNFGHTIGHAIEAAGGYKAYNHGEAIALGMLAACDISRQLGLVKKGACVRIERLIKAVGLPVKIEKCSLKDIISAHYRDKKFIGAINRFVLVKDIGEVIIIKAVPLKLIEEALRNRLSYPH